MIRLLALAWLLLASGGYQGCNATHPGCRASGSGWHRCGDTGGHSGPHACRYEGCTATWN